MAQHRDLVPMTVYVPPGSKDEAESRAQAKGVASGTLLRMILHGKEEPLKGVNSGR